MSRPAPAAPRAPLVALRRAGPPVLLLAAAVAAWQAVAGLTAVDDLTLASPTETLAALARDLPLLLDAAGVTLLEVVLGLALAVAMGAAVAVGMHLVRPLREAAYPLLVASQAIPVVVLAPLFVLAFDYGLAPKLAIVALICFFPVTVNLLDGLRSVEPDLLKLMRSLGASGSRPCAGSSSRPRCPRSSAACAWPRRCR